jgi:four helix bundle protein
MSYWSLSELETHLEIAYRFKFIDQNSFDKLLNKTRKISTQLSGLMKSIETKISQR